MDAYWTKYDQTLARVVSERPTTFDDLKVILDSFEPPSSGEAFFPGGADETLGHALTAAGWRVNYREGDYVWVARSAFSGELITYVEGDLYRGDQTMKGGDSDA